MARTIPTVAEVIAARQVVASKTAVEVREDDVVEANTDLLKYGEALVDSAKSALVAEYVAKGYKTARVGSFTKISLV